jgi:hypothetical protein
VFLEVLILKDFKSLFPEVWILKDFKSFTPEVLILVEFKFFTINTSERFRKFVRAAVGGAWRIETGRTRLRGEKCRGDDVASRFMR